MVEITHRQWNLQITRIVNKNLRIHGHSLSRASISNRCSDLVVDSRTTTKIVQEDWRNEMKRRFLENDIKGE